MKSKIKGKAILNAVIRAAAKGCAMVEGMPSCATCADAGGMRDGEPGAEHNIRCEITGEFMRRYERCENYRPNAITLDCDVLPILKETFAPWGIQIGCKAKRRGGEA